MKALRSLTEAEFRTRVAHRECTSCTIVPARLYNAGFCFQSEQTVHGDVPKGRYQPLDAVAGVRGQGRAEELVMAFSEGERDLPSKLEPENDWRDGLLALMPSLRAFAWSLSHDASDADDLVQDTLFKAWSNQDRFAAGGNLRAWLFTILRNTFYTSLHRRRREVRDEDGKHAALLTEPASQEWSMSVQALRTAMMELPLEHREALILVGGAGLTYQEAADICGCAIGTIKSRVNRARAKLAGMLDMPTDDAEAPSVDHED
jgi:RNA polymerase sigma-70 factor (ECF subfamily)